MLQAAQRLMLRKADRVHYHDIADVNFLQDILDELGGSVDWGDLGGSIDLQMDLIARLALKQNLLGYTPENIAAKGQALGYAPLGADLRVPSAYLPVHIDEVQEYATLAAFPALGLISIIYIDLATDREYRWTGTVYREISPSPGNTDAVPEGSANLYFTASRVRASLLTGLAVGTNVGIIAADTMLGALAKLQAQITAIVNGLATHIADVSVHLTAAEKSAVVGTFGTPGAANKFVTDTDPRNTNARTPTAHGHLATDITETANMRFVTDAQRIFLQTTSYAHNNAVQSGVKIRTYNGSVAGGAGNVSFIMTDTGLAGGAAAFTASVSMVVPIVNGNAANYTYSWTVSGDRKTIAINVKASTNVLAGLINVLGSSVNAADGTVVTCLVIGF